MIIFCWQIHLSTALFVAFGLDYFLLDFNLVQMILFYLFVIVGAFLPDIDKPTSWIGRRFKILSTFIYKLVDHRTMTHSIIVITSIYFLSSLFFSVNVINSGISLGMLVHVIGDMFNGKVNIMWPINKNMVGFLKNKAR